MAMANAMLSYVDHFQSYSRPISPAANDAMAPLHQLASAPLLSPFQMSAPYSSSQTALLRILADEINASEMVSLLQRKEAQLQNELQKERGREAKEAETNKRKKKRPSNINAATNAMDRIKALTAELDTISSSLISQRQDLQHLNNFVRSALQCEYSKLAVTLSPDSSQYTHLEQCIDYLFNDEDRCTYFVEMASILKKMTRSKSTQGVEALPLIQQFMPSSQIIESLQEELWHHSLYEEIRKSLSNRTTASAHLTGSQQKLLKYASDSLEKASAVAIDRIKKHYRKKSIKLHPDRMGEEYRPSFEKFTLAKDILIDNELRLRYLREMSHVYFVWARNEEGESVLGKGHDAWMERYGMKIGVERVQDEVKRLEGGLQHQCLAAPLVKIESNERDSKVDLSIRVPKPMYEFYSRVRNITVVFNSTHGVVHKMEMTRSDIVKPLQATRESELILPSQIYVGQQVLDEGYWDIRWSATLDGIGSSPTDPNNATEEVIPTNESYSFTMIVTDKARARNLQQLDAIEKSCKIVKGNLANGLHIFNNFNGANRYECHGLLVRASKMHRNLKAAMDRVGQTNSPIYDELGALLSSSRGIMAQIELMSARDGRKDDARRFKSFMAKILESENPIEWMKCLQPEYLEEEGGNINRLYQLFIEGKGKCALLIDSEMLKEASLRSDLFSTKQCKELMSRSEAVAIQEAIEEEESRAESERRLAEAEARQKMIREAELRQKWEMVGNTVSIDGLQSDTGVTMNSATAKVIYYHAEKDRFEVEVVGSGKKAYLKKENLTVIYYGLPTQNHVLASQQQSNVTVKPSVEKKIEHTPPSQSKAKTPKAKAFPKNHTISNVRQHKNPSSTKSCASVPATIHTSPIRTEKTLYVASTVAKKLTGKKGRSKKALEEQSGAKLDIRSSQATDGCVPVSCSGTHDSVVRAMALVKNAVGSENVREKIPASNPHVNQTVHIAHVNQKPLARPVRHTPPESPKHSHPAPSEAEINGASEARPRQLFPPGFPGVQTEGFTSFAQPPSQLPSEIGIRDNAQREPDGSVSSLNDRSNSSRTLQQQHFPLPENDPLLQFVRTQQNCIKGNVDEFFVWLVKSEDIDTIASLKEAVSDEEYLAETMKNGNGTVGLKGFKRKAFQRAVLDHQESVTASTTATSAFDATESNVLLGIESNAFLPSFLYSEFENAVKPSANQTGDQAKSGFVLDDDDTAPPELVCPITHELMVDDPVLAADGVTYERSTIENWFHNQVAQLKMAEEQLRANPHLRREQELVQRGVCSPLYGTPMHNLNLTPNTSVRNMARAHRDRANTELRMTSLCPSNVSMFRFAN